MPIKIFGQIEEKVRELVLDGYTNEYVAKETALSQGTILSWCRKNGLTLGKYRNPELRSKEIKFVELMKSGSILKHACVAVDVCGRTGMLWVSRNGLTGVVRTRADAALDKSLSMEEANSRLPEGHGRVVRYDQVIGEYVVERSDGTFYSRITSQIFRGDPQLSEKKRDTEEEVSVKLLEYGYRLIPGTYTAKNEPLRAEHIECGYVRQNDFRMIFKQSCPKCTNTGTSTPEQEIFSYVESLGLNTTKFYFERDYAGKGKPKEIDVYVESLKFGIEYCGFYYHGENYKARSLDRKLKKFEKRGLKYEKTDFDSPVLCHKAKMDKANSLGIQLITVFTHEWRDSQDKVRAVLKAKLGKNEIKIHARKTELKEIDKEEARKFLDLYHLQGYEFSTVCFGLFSGEELVGVITGGYHHKNGVEFTLNRLCFKSNTTVVGGSSKLHAALENWAKSNGFSEIKTWSDNRWSEGGVYEALGYELRHDIGPAYFYFNGAGKVFTVYSLRKKKMLRMGATGKTEPEMAKSLKFDRIFDCGKKAWIKKLV